MARILEGRTALVTGGGQGVGQGVSRALAEAGADLVVAQRNVEVAEREAAYLRDTFGVRAFARRADVTDRDDVDAMVADAAEKLGRLDILVNNAGASIPKRVEKHSDEEMLSMFDVNCMSAFRAMRAAFPIMKAQNYGRIINMGSMNGVNAHMFTVSYNAAKEGVRALTRTAAVEWAKHGITANIICPSAFSPASETYFADNPDMLALLCSQIPAGRIGDATRDIGPIAVFLASEESRFLTGSTLFADGGSHINGVSWRPEVED